MLDATETLRWAGMGSFFELLRKIPVLLPTTFRPASQAPLKLRRRKWGEDGQIWKREEKLRDTKRDWEIERDYQGGLMGVGDVDHKEGWNDLQGKLEDLWPFANVLVYPASTATVGAMTLVLQWSCSPGQGQSDQEVLVLTEKMKNITAMLFLPTSGILNSRSGSKNSTDKLVISVVFKAALCRSPLIILLYFLTWPGISVSL